MGYLGTRAPLKRVLRPASGHHLPCSLLPFSFDSSLAAAPPSISQFLASENFSFLRFSLLPSFFRKTIDPNSKRDQERTFHPFARNRIFFFSIFSLLPSVFRVLERKKERNCQLGLVSESDVTRLRGNYLYFAPRRIPRMRESKVLRTFSVGQRPTTARSTYYAIP